MATCDFCNILYLLLVSKNSSSRSSSYKNVYLF